MRHLHLPLYAGGKGPDVPVHEILYPKIENLQVENVVKSMLSRQISGLTRTSSTPATVLHEPEIRLCYPTRFRGEPAGRLPHKPTHQRGQSDIRKSIWRQERFTQSEKLSVPRKNRRYYYWSCVPRAGVSVVRGRCSRLGEKMRVEISRIGDRN
jgi:hypothetical protein